MKMGQGMDGVPPTAWMERLFARLRACYGNRMATMYGDCPAADIHDAWREGLRGMPADKIKLGLERVVVEHPEWPPTLGEFLALCRRVQPAAHREFAALPAPKRGPIPDAVRGEIDSLLGKWRTQ